MLRLCHSRAPASEGTSKLERSTGIDCMRPGADARSAPAQRASFGRRRAGCDELPLAHDPNPKARRPRI